MMRHTHAGRRGTPGPLTDAERLAAKTFGREAPCSRCGYSLRNAAGPRCPECGAPLGEALRRGVRNRWTPAFLAGCMAFFISILLLGWLVLALPRWGPQGRADLPGSVRLFVVIVWIVASVIAGARWLDWGWEMAGWPRAIAWRWAALCWAGPAVGAVLVVWLAM